MPVRAPGEGAADRAARSATSVGRLSLAARHPPRRRLLPPLAQPEEVFGRPDGAQGDAPLRPRELVAVGDAGQRARVRASATSTRRRWRSGWASPATTSAATPARRRRSARSSWTSRRIRSSSRCTSIRKNTTATSATAACSVPRSTSRTRMNVVVTYDSDAILSYSLNAASPWEGYEVTFNGTKGRLEHKVVEQAELRVRQRQRARRGEGLRHLAARASAAQARLRRRAAHRPGEPRRRRRRDAGRSVRADAGRRSAAARGRRAKRRVFDPGRRRGQPLLRDRRDRAASPIWSARSPRPTTRACRREPRRCRCRSRSRTGPVAIPLGPSTSTSDRLPARRGRHRRCRHIRVPRGRGDGRTTGAGLRRRRCRSPRDPPRVRGDLPRTPRQPGRRGNLTLFNPMLGIEAMCSLGHRAAAVPRATRFCWA